MRMVNRHSFNPAVAEDYGVEKAIIIDFFMYLTNTNFVWVKEEYLYDTAEEFAKIFTYFDSKKIAYLLRQMEDDGLIQSVQGLGMNRTKGYKLTEKAKSYYSNTL